MIRKSAVEAAQAVAGPFRDPEESPNIEGQGAP